MPLRAPARASPSSRPIDNHRAVVDTERVVTVAFHKPYGVLSRFTPDGSRHATLAGFGLPRDVWPLGRLDADSEGLLLLSSNKALTARLMAPSSKAKKIYHAQVEGLPDDAALHRLRHGVELEGVMTRPAEARRLPDPGYPPRDPPIRYRKSVPDCWIELSLVEGKNRQVRRMTAAVGHPTLRLIRVAVGPVRLGDLGPGTFALLDEAMETMLLRPAR
jgi:23S rRNA pseudouridine2457 synthase